MDRLVVALHDRCLADEMLNHPFSHEGDPDHLAHLAAYLGEALGGPPTYSSSLGGQSAMITIHTATGAYDEMATRFVTCFDLAVDDAGWPDDPEFRAVLHEYMVWASADVQRYAPLDATAPGPLPFPRWSWNGRQTD